MPLPTSGAASKTTPRTPRELKSSGSRTLPSLLPSSQRWMRCTPAGERGFRFGCHQSVYFGESTAAACTRSCRRCSLRCGLQRDDCHREKGSRSRLVVEAAAADGSTSSLVTARDIWVCKCKRRTYGPSFNTCQLGVPGCVRLFRNKLGQYSWMQFRNQPLMQGHHGSRVLSSGNRTGRRHPL